MVWPLIVVWDCFAAGVCWLAPNSFFAGGVFAVAVFVSLNFLVTLMQKRRSK